MVSFYESNIWDGFHCLVHRIYLITELLKIFFISYFLVFYHSEDDLINYVGIMLLQIKKEELKKKKVDFMLKKPLQSIQRCVFLSN